MDELFAKEVEVTSEDREALAAAIKSAYPDRRFFYLRLANRWGLDVDDDIISTTQPGSLVASAIVAYAASQGRTLDLLALAWTDVPGNPMLRGLADRFFSDQAEVRAKYAPLPPAGAPTNRPPLEKLVEKRSKLIRIDRFVDAMKLLSGALCRISIDDTVKGTGFLVGRRAVLTNFHVMKDAIGPLLDGGKIKLEFDYHGDAGACAEYRAAPGIGWKLMASPYSESDLTGVGEPGPDELDFTLVKLAQDVEPTRAPIPWPVAPPIVSQRDFVVIGQHPGGDASSVAFGEVVAYPGSGLRYRYDVTTLPGSSGSPVLSLDQELIALHHAADVTANPRYNQGVPIARIMAALKVGGVDLASL